MATSFQNQGGKEVGKKLQSLPKCMWRKWIYSWICFPCKESLRQGFAHEFHSIFITLGESRVPSKTSRTSSHTKLPHESHICSSWESDPLMKLVCQGFHWHHFRCLQEQEKRFISRKIVEISQICMQNYHYLEHDKFQPRPGHVLQFRGHKLSKVAGPWGGPTGCSWPRSCPSYLWGCDLPP